MGRYVITDAYGRYRNTILWNGVSPLSLSNGDSAVAEEAYVPLPGEGSPYHLWNSTTHQYELSEALMEQARATKWEEIKEYREKIRNSSGFKVAGLYWFHSDTPSRFDQLGLVNAMMMNALPANTPWTLMDGTEVLLTTPIIQGVFAAHMNLRGTNFAVSKAHKAALWASTDPLNYDFTGGGWVPIFGE